MKKRITQSRLLRAGLWIWLFGCGPLLLFTGLNYLGVGVSDNPIGLGLLFIAAGSIGFVCVVVGIALSLFGSKDDSGSGGLL